jgi:hypothetical protein
VLLSLAIFIASGRLIPRLLQRQRPTYSDSFLIASLVNPVALFITDVMTYKWGGMADDDAPEPPIERLIALKKVSCLVMRMDLWLTISSLGTICWQCLLRYWHLLAEVGDSGAILSTRSPYHAVATQSTLRSHHFHRRRDDNDILPRHILVRPRSLFQLVSRRGCL